VRGQRKGEGEQNPLSCSKSLDQLTAFVDVKGRLRKTGHIERGTVCKVGGFVCWSRELATGEEKHQHPSRRGKGGFLGGPNGRVGSGKGHGVNPPPRTSGKSSII